VHWQDGFVGEGASLIAKQVNVGVDQAGCSAAIHTYPCIDPDLKLTCSVGEQFLFQEQRCWMDEVGTG
jgi:hypothetical protein